MTSTEEAAFEDGNRAAWVAMLGLILTRLGYDGSPAASLIAEREAAIVTQREHLT